MRFRQPRPIDVARVARVVRVAGVAAILTVCAAACVTPTASAVEHPFVELVKRYRKARITHDDETVARLQAGNARVWFQEREGDGRKLSIGGDGPWADWDRFFNAKSEALDFRVEGRSVRMTNLENNDWYRLVDREPVPYYVYYFIDADGRIEGKLIRAIEGVERKPDRLPEFKAWAREKHPGLLEILLPNEEIDPALEKARLWKERLIEWRRDVGLPEALAPATSEAPQPESDDAESSGP